MQIKTENLSYVYSEKSKSMSVKALDGVSLKIDEGEFFGIIGKTGSGKTTFVQHLNGLIKLSEGRGSIVIGDYDLSDKKCDYKSLRSKVGMVFQYPEYQLFSETVEDDVAFALKNFFPEISESEMEERVSYALSLVGLDYKKLKGRSPFEMSGGQKRRIAIAGVIIAKPEILVLDEPVAGLDPKGKNDFMELLLKLKKEFVKTVIIVSHDMNLVAEYCTKVAIFNGGKISACASPEEVFSDYSNTFKNELSLPLTAYLKKSLSDCGVKVNGIKEEEFVKSVIEKFGGRK